MDDPGALTEAERGTIVVATGAADHRLFALSGRLAGAGYLRPNEDIFAPARMVGRHGDQPSNDTTMPSAR